MLFNSFEFIVLFLPISLIGFFLLAKKYTLLAAGWLVACSLFFYGWWNPLYVSLLLCSILFNYILGLRLAKMVGRKRYKTVRVLLFFGVAANLVLLAYYKYSSFFVDTINVVFHAGWKWEDVVLPLGISFFTFTQIAFLVDVSKGVAAEYNIIHYFLFVTYFPHLIAGPVLHHKEMMPQFKDEKTYSLCWKNFSAGLTLFAFGLFKKVSIADRLAVGVIPVFAVDAHPTLLDAWSGVLSYTLQIYFDFSGYSDMAIGLSLLFGINLPINFLSPYKSRSIIEFWRRWHMTLSRFLRDYLYIPLGGSRLGYLRRHSNLFVTMVLGGMWHGAGWTFIIWGGIHAFYLMINHAWEAIRNVIKAPELPAVVGGLTTFLAVVIGWVFFRAPNLQVAFDILDGMVGRNGVAVSAQWLENFGAMASSISNILSFNGCVIVQHPLLVGGLQQVYILGGLFIIWLFPNTQQIMQKIVPNIYGSVKFSHSSISLAWEPRWYWVLITAILFGISLSQIGSHSEFLYFQF